METLRTRPTTVEAAARAGARLRLAASWFALLAARVTFAVALVYAVGLLTR